MNRILAGSLVFFIVCCSGVFFGCEKGGGKGQPVTIKGQITNDSKNYEKKYGPFDIGKNRIVVLYTLKWEDDGREVRSVELKNEAGSSYYKASDIGVDLEGAFKLESQSGEGLILYFETVADAPPGGKLFQIFGMEKEKVKPHGTRTEYQPPQPTARGLSVPAQGRGGDTTQPGMEYGHHLHSPGAGLCVSGGGNRLVLA